MKTQSRNKTSRLRDLIESQELSFLMEAHSGLSAKVAAQAGFEGIWASGLSISAMLGVRDANEASWSPTHVIAVHHETTTWRLNDLAALGVLCRRFETPMLVDAISSFGGEEIDFAGWNIGLVRRIHG